jgi:hypothetical protein
MISIKLARLLADGVANEIANVIAAAFATSFGSTNRRDGAPQVLWWHARHIARSKHAPISPSGSINPSLT